MPFSTLIDTPDLAVEHEVTEAEAEIMALLDKWAAALNQHDLERVVSLYADRAVLLPTISSELRTDHDRIRAYFEMLFQRMPKLRVVQSILHHFGGNVAVRSGIYVFTLDKDGKTDNLWARFTFIYHQENGEWKIMTHHSSTLPETPTNLT
ncbi:MAG: SgcJ/EcaC family oxidoreductase [Candidatus Symbiobacter sp.]|nr:SgcJ/EcaC family oxidoreductase [Candidatus Symbiobacter sp.]